MIIWILAFWVAQRFRDICDSQFEDSEIQFQPDFKQCRTTLDLVWFVWYSIMMIEQRGGGGQSELPEIQFKLDSWHCNWIWFPTLHKVFLWGFCNACLSWLCKIFIWQSKKLDSNVKSVVNLETGCGASIKVPVPYMLIIRCTLRQGFDDQNMSLSIVKGHPIIQYIFFIYQKCFVWVSAKDWVEFQIKSNKNVSTNIVNGKFLLTHRTDISRAAWHHVCLGLFDCKVLHWHDCDCYCTIIRCSIGMVVRP